jgi:hypothetical protein
MSHENQVFKEATTLSRSLNDYLADTDETTMKVLLDRQESLLAFPWFWEKMMAYVVEDEVTVDDFNREEYHILQCRDESPDSEPIFVLLAGDSDSEDWAWGELEDFEGVFTPEEISALKELAKADTFYYPGWKDRSDQA